jgi:hypothetical protein
MSTITPFPACQTFKTRVNKSGNRKIVPNVMQTLIIRAPRDIIKVDVWNQV